MKNFLVLVFAMAIIFCFVLARPYRTQASSINSRQIAETCDTQDPNSPCFAPGERGDNEPGCDIYNPDSPCFAPGEKADTPTPTSQNYYTPTPKTTTATPVPEPSSPSKEDILNMTNDGDSGATGLLGALFLSPIVGMFGSLIFIGVIILVVFLLIRHSKKNTTGSDQNSKPEKENNTKENK